jgi:hypothetical protein
LLAVFSQIYDLNIKLSIPIHLLWIMGHIFDITAKLNMQFV